MHRTQEPITAFDEELRALVADMVATMYAADGVGLAACQIGVDRVGVRLRLPRRDGRAAPSAWCATRCSSCPRASDRQLDDDDEGCLSLPGRVRAVRPPVVRPGRGAGRSTARRSATPATGLLARCLQHETDHCHGTVFGDRLNKRSRKKLFKQADEASPSSPPAGRPDATTVRRTPSPSDPGP